MNAEHFVGKVRQSALIVANDTGRILLTRDSRVADLWEFPGGRLHSNEAPLEGLRRELREELGIEVEFEAIFHTLLMLHSESSAETFFVVYKVTVPTETLPFVFDPIEVAAIQWVDQNSCTTLNVYPDVRETLEYYFK